MSLLKINNLRTFVSEKAAKLIGKVLFLVIVQISTLLFTFLSTVWIARCLGPEELGKSGLIFATANQLLLILSVCPNSYAVRITKEALYEAEAVKVVLASRILACGLYLVMILVLLSTVSFQGEWFDLAVLGLPIPILMALQSSWIHQSREDQTIQYLIMLVIAFANFIFVVAYIRPQSLANLDVAGRVLGLCVGFIFGWYFVKARGGLNFPSFEYIIPAIKETWKSRSIFVTQILIYTFTALELPLMAYLGTVEQLGLYRTAVQLSLAVNSILMIAPMIYYPKFVSWNLESSYILWINQNKIARIGLLVVIPCGILALAIGPTLFEIFFGEKYSEAGLPFAMLALAKLVTLLNGIYSWGLWARSRDNEMLIIYLVAAVTSLSLNVGLIPSYGMLAAAIVNLSSQLLILILAYLVTRRTLKSR